MDTKALTEILNKVQSGELSAGGAVDMLAQLPFVDLGHTKVDTHREIRCGMEEVVYAERKTDEQLEHLVHAHIVEDGRVLVTRLRAERFPRLARRFPQLEYSEVGMVAAFRNEPPDVIGNLAILSAGTSDQIVAEEASACARYFGFNVFSANDVGVAGLPRLLSVVDTLNKQDVVIIIAGMEGALPSVAAGLIRAPIIGVPTSVGYGASFGGITALLSMLVSCSAGVSIVNIDNGFGAVAAALRFIRQFRSNYSGKLGIPINGTAK